VKKILRRRNNKMIKTTLMVNLPRKEKITTDDIGQLFLWVEIPHKTNNTKYNPCLLSWDSLVSLSNPNNTWGCGINETLSLINSYINDGLMIVAPKGYTIQITQE
jgi:hypothetical protein